MVETVESSAGELMPATKVGSNSRVILRNGAKEASGVQVAERGQAEGGEGKGTTETREEQGRSSTSEGQQPEASWGAETGTRLSPLKRKRGSSITGACPSTGNPQRNVTNSNDACKFIAVVTRGYI